MFFLIMYEQINLNIVNKLISYYLNEKMQWNSEVELLKIY